MPGFETSIRSWWNYVRNDSFTDIKNILSYGSEAPLAHELIYSDASEVEYQLIPPPGYNIRRLSGTVVDDGFWRNCKVVPIDQSPKFQYCKEHWILGRPWKETRAYPFLLKMMKKKGMVDNCRSEKDLEVRFRKLDSLYNQVKRMGRLKRKKELDPSNFREKQGILVHIGPHGEPLFGGGGNHRFAMAKILNITFPAELGIVHENAIKHLSKYRE